MSVNCTLYVNTCVDMITLWSAVHEFGSALCIINVKQHSKSLGAEPAISGISFIQKTNVFRVKSIIYINITE